MSEELIFEEEEGSGRGLVVVPGISSRPFGSPFDEVVRSVRVMGFLSCVLMLGMVLMS